MDLPPDAGAEIGWYDTLVRWTSLSWFPLHWLSFHPLIPPSLVLFWLIPVLTTVRRRGTGTTGMPHPPRLRLALKAGLAGGFGAIAASLVLVFIAPSILPATVWHNPEGTVYLSATPFTSVHDLVYVVVAVLAHVLAAAVVAARATRHRPILTLLAISVTGTVATIGLLFATITVSRCADLFGGKLPDMSASSLRRFIMHSPHYIAQHAHWIIVKGAVAAVPAALLGAGIGALYRRWRSTATDRDERPPGILTIAALTLVALVMIAATAAGFPTAWRSLTDDPRPPQTAGDAGL